MTRDGIGAPFWQAAADGRLVVPLCTGCDRRFYVPEPVCPHCLSSAWTYVDSPGTGTIYSYSVVSRGPSAEFAASYVLAAVDLDDGWTMLTNIVGCSPAELVSGLRVRVLFESRSLGGTDVVVPVFTPDCPVEEESSS